jgi:hypothetical protein
MSALLRLALASIQRREIPMEELARLSSVFSFPPPFGHSLINARRTIQFPNMLRCKKPTPFCAKNFHHGIFFLIARNRFREFYKIRARG